MPILYSILLSGFMTTGLSTVDWNQQLQEVAVSSKIPL